MRLAWLPNTRPDLLFEISQLAQVTLEISEQDDRAHWKRLNKAIRYARVNVTNLRIPSLECKSIRTKGHSDAAFHNNHDLKSQLGRIIILVDDNNSAIPIIFKSNKSRRVTVSFLSAELTVFENLFDDIMAIRSQIE